MENKYYFKYRHNNINLNDFINNYEIGELKKPEIIYIQNDINEDSYIKVRSKKPYDYYIDYHNIEENAFINVAINIIAIYFKSNDRPNIISFYCDFIPDINTKKHPIFEIKEYLTKTLWNKEKFNFKRAEKGYTDLSTFKTKIIKAHNQKAQLKLFPDFQPIIKIGDRFN